MIRKIWNRIEKKKLYRLAMVLTAALTLLGIFLPGYFLAWQSRAKMNMAGAVPAGYYSPANLAVARNASANLGNYQKLQLITEKWESNEAQAGDGEKSLENYEAVELAREKIHDLYKEKLYPVSLLSNYENWYSWEAEFCKVVDATFHTYTAYYWELTFVRYDGSQKHRICMLEDGTVFLAQAWNPNGIETDTLTKISDSGINLIPTLDLFEQTEVEADDADWKAYFSSASIFSSIETGELQQMDLVVWQAGEQQYRALQAASADQYLLAVWPE